MRAERIPLFPLNVVLLPGAQLSLHIFEPRYREMVRDCLLAKSCFGVVLATEDGVAGVGCTSEITEVVQRYEDGRLDILTVGRRPFRVLEFLTQEPLLRARVEYLEDEEDVVDSAVRSKLLELYEVCYTIAFESFPKELTPTDEIYLSYAVLEALPIDLRWKQQILELRSEPERQARLTAYLRDWAPHLQKLKVARAGGSDCKLN
ncbi:MAG TPA: LON peptidase substrate-binding domain-containing protein [Candidatus Dormibacteraeota bacterium]|nr:LON peptidase substrate-binding domain-containing protein [Candidatus Dormibacteraeota bacterium]